MPVLMTSKGISKANLKNLVRYFDTHKQVLLIAQGADSDSVLKMQAVYEGLGYQVDRKQVKEGTLYDIVHILSDDIKVLDAALDYEFIEALDLNKILVVTQGCATVLLSQVLSDVDDLKRRVSLTQAAVLPSDSACVSEELKPGTIKLKNHEAYYEYKIFKTII